MRIAIGGLAALALPAVLAAQSAAASGSHELGIDATFVYGKASGLPSTWAIGTPVDIRVGFVSQRRWMLELSGSFEAGGSSGSKSGDGGIGLAVLCARDHHQGMYILGGASAAFVGATGAQTSIAPGLTAGVGTRLPRGASAIRLEAFGRYVFESSSNAPASTRLGVRAGLSLWR